MASRLYRTTRLLYLCVCQALDRLRLGTLGTPTLAVLIAWTVTGLILLDARPTQTRVARRLPGRCHDAMGRLLRTMPWSTRALMALLIVFAKRLGRAGYLVLDEVIVEKAFAKRLTWHGTLDPKTSVVWRGRKQAVRELAGTLKLRWRAKLGVRATAVRVFAPKYGHLSLVVTRNRHGNYEYLVSNDLTCDVANMVLRKRSRWSVETVFRDSKQFSGLEGCQCWTDQPLVRHVSLVFLTFVVLQLLRHSCDEPVGTVKERWQLAVIQAGEVPPAPLRACPPHVRATA